MLTAGPWQEAQLIALSRAARSGAPVGRAPAGGAGRELTRPRLRPRASSMPGMTSAPPNVCIIGAGVSGLTACKALDDFGVPHTCFEASDEVGGNWYFQNPNGVSSAYRSLHIDISKPSISFRDFPMPDRYPDYPHHTPHLRVAVRLRRRLRRAAQHPLQHARDARRARPAGRLGDHARRRLDRTRFDALLVCNGHHWDPRWPSFPGSFDGPQIHSHDYVDPSDPLDLKGKRVLVVGIGNSAVDIVSELGRKTMCEMVFLSTRSGAYVVPEVPVRQTGRPDRQDQPDAPREAAAADGSAAAADLLRAHGGLRPADPQPQLPRRPPDRLQRAARAARRGRRGRQGRRRGAARRLGALRRRQRRARRRDHLRDRLQRQLPVLRARLPERAGQRAAALQADAQTGHRRPRLHRARPADPDDLPVRRAAVEARRALAERRLGAAAGRERWSRRSSPTRPSTRRTSSPSRATRCSSSGTRTSASSKSARSRTGRQRARGGRADRARRRGPARRSCLARRA